MGYTDQDQLAINTIRVLAVSTYLTLISVAVVFFFWQHAAGYPGVVAMGRNRCQLVEWPRENEKLTFGNVLFRSMPRPLPTPAIPVLPWALLPSPMSCSTSL